MKDHVDMIIGNKVRKTCQVTCAKCGEQGHHYKTCKGAPKDPNWKTKSRQTKKAKSGEKARKNKKKKPRVTPSSDIGQAEEVDYSQSAPTPEEHAAPNPMPGPSHSLPAQPLPARFHMKQPIVRPPSTASANPKEPQQFTFMPTPGFRPPRHI
ncbi:hypothetical protein PIB30_025594 [Stylosanthes scabra]|uniref:CCHC-type domain-containing protein n=1 Tax=Stylosanthes scabra TaxID=79078 RepID=A0ABU6S9N2_9FABA|nr:hypothetical protein [Stylosanthes scabra]